MNEIPDHTLKVEIECRCGYIVGGIGEIQAWKQYAWHLEDHVASALSGLTHERKRIVKGKIVPPVRHDETGDTHE